MTAYFDKNNDLWIEVQVMQVPEDTQTTGTVYTQTLQSPVFQHNHVLGNYTSPSYQTSHQTAVTFMNLTKYIHDQTLIKIAKKLDDETR
jgi:hypothetical protein